MGCGRHIAGHEADPEQELLLPVHVDGLVPDRDQEVSVGEHVRPSAAPLSEGIQGGEERLAQSFPEHASRSANRLLEVTVEAVRPIPSIALIPIALLVLGFGPGMEIAIVAFSCVWPILILARAAVASVEPQLLEVARALGLAFGARVVKIVLPAALPRLLVALRVAVGVALVVAVTVEIAADPRGLGNAIMVSEQALQPALMLAYLLWIGLIGFALNAALGVAQGRLLGPAAAGARP